MFPRNVSYFCSEQLKQNYNLGKFFIEVNLAHLKLFDEDSELKLRKYPIRFVPAVSLFFLFCFFLFVGEG